jgi:hypothetical protein
MYAGMPLSALDFFYTPAHDITLYNRVHLGRTETDMPHAASLKSRTLPS